MQIHDHVILAKQISTSVATAGTRQRVELGDLPMELEGMPTHLVALVLRVTVQYDAVAATMAAAMPGHLLATCLRNVRLEAESHAFVDNLTGSDLRDDYEWRFGAKWTANPSDVADGDATNATATVEIPLFLADPRPAAGAEQDGVVPVALFDHKKAGQNVLTFDVGTGFLDFAGVTIDNVSVDVYAIVRPLPELRIPSPHSIRELVSTELDIKVTADGCFDYAIIKDRKDSSGNYGEGTHDDYANIAVTLGSRILGSGLTVAQLAIMHNAIRNGLKALTATTAAEAIPLLDNSDRAYRTKRHRGRLRVQIGTRSDHSTTRIFYRDTGRQTQSWLSRCAKTLGIVGPASFEARQAKPTKLAGFAQEFLDMAVYGAGLAERGMHVAAAKAVRKSQG